MRCAYTISCDYPARIRVYFDRPVRNARGEVREAMDVCLACAGAAILNTGDVPMIRRSVMVLR